jgi:hypothetical protein
VPEQDPSKLTVREVMERAEAGDPQARRMLDDFSAKAAAIEAEGEAARKAVLDSFAEASRNAQEHAKLVADARDGIQSIRDIAEAAATASEEREARSEEREESMVNLTDRLLKLTVVLVILGALSLAGSVVAVLVAA